MEYGSCFKARSYIRVSCWRYARPDVLIIDTAVSISMTIPGYGNQKKIKYSVKTGGYTELQYSRLRVSSACARCQKQPVMTHDIMIHDV